MAFYQPRPGLSDNTEAIAAALLRQALGGGPVVHPFQGLARLAQAYGGRTLMDRAERERDEDESKRDFAQRMSIANALAARETPSVEEAGRAGLTPGELNQRRIAESLALGQDAGLDLGALMDLSGLGQQSDAETFSLLGPEEEVAAFGSDLPGSFQRGSRGGVQRIEGTEPETADPFDRFTNVPGVGLVDLAGEGGPSISIAQPREPASTTRPLTADEVAEIGLPVGTVAEVDSTGDVTILHSPPETAATKPTERDNKIAQYQELYGVDLATATALADGLKSIKADPKEGRFYIVDEIRGTVEAAPVAGGTTPEIEALNDLATTGEAILARLAEASNDPATFGRPRGASGLGLEGAVRRGLNVTLGQAAPETFGSPDAAQMTTDIAAIKAKALKIAAANPERPLARELEMAAAALPDSGVFSSNVDVRSKIERVIELARQFSGRAETQRTGMSSGAEKPLTEMSDEELLLLLGLP